MKTILIAKGKHDEYIFPYSTKQEQEKTTKKLFKNNCEYENYYDISDEGTIKDTETELTETLADLKYAQSMVNPGQYMRDFITENKARAEKLTKELNDLRLQRNLYKAAMKGDVKSMYSLLHLRRDYQYESYEIKNLG